MIHFVFTVQYVKNFLPLWIVLELKVYIYIYSLIPLNYICFKKYLFYEQYTARFYFGCTLDRQCFGCQCSVIFFLQHHYHSFVKSSSITSFKYVFVKLWSKIVYLFYMIKFSFYHLIWFLELFILKYWSNIEIYVVHYWVICLF